MNHIQNFKYHTKTVELINKQINDNNVSHAYLFYGSSSTLKLQLTLCFAAAINDVGLDKIKTENISPDVFDNNPDINVYSPNGVNGYLVSQIQELLHDVKKTPLMMHYKINILQNVEKMNAASANAFLLTLEEPPTYCINILLCNQIDKVLPTIISRCQVIKIDDLCRNDCVEIVSSDTGALATQAEYALDIHQGDIKSSCNYLQNQQMIDLVKYINLVLKSIDTQRLNDWNILEYSSKVVQSIKEIVNSYDKKLEAELIDKSEVLEGPALKELQNMNKRKVSSLQTQILNLITNVVINHQEKKLKQLSNQKELLTQTYCINSLLKMQEKLRYNINLQTYCDVLLLKVKNDNNCPG